MSGETSVCAGEGSTDTELATGHCAGENVLEGVELADDNMPLCIAVGLDDEKKIVHTEVEKGCGCPESFYNLFEKSEIYSA